MNPWKIRFGFMMAFLPAYVTPSSYIKCLACGTQANEIMAEALHNQKGICGKPLPGGMVCKVQRTKKLYRCSSSTCGAITSKNRQHLQNEPEGCYHENRQILQHGITPTSGASSSQPVVPSEELSSGPVVESEEIPGTNGLRYFHFL
jgi:hypothetical protein